MAFDGQPKSYIQKWKGKVPVIRTVIDDILNRIEEKTKVLQGEKPEFFTEDETPRINIPDVYSYLTKLAKIEDIDWVKTLFKKDVVKIYRLDCDFYICFREDEKYDEEKYDEEKYKEFFLIEEDELKESIDKYSLKLCKELTIAPKFYTKHDDFEMEIQIVYLSRDKVYVSSCHFPGKIVTIKQLKNVKEFDDIENITGHIKSYDNLIKLIEF